MSRQTTPSGDLTRERLLDALRQRLCSRGDGPYSLSTNASLGSDLGVPDFLLPHHLKVLERRGRIACYYRNFGLKVRRAVVLLDMEGAEDARAMLAAEGWMDAATYHDRRSAVYWN